MPNLPKNLGENLGQSCARICKGFVFLAIKTAGDPQPEGGGCQGVRPEQALVRGPGPPLSCQAQEACGE